MTNIDTLLHARWVIPVEPENTILENHAIAVHHGRILELLDSKQAGEKYNAEQNVQLKEHVLLPGLINTHTHSAMNLMRGISDDLPLMEWLQQHIWPTEQKHVSAEFVYDGSMLACAEMLRSGTTCFNDMYFYPEETARVVEHTGMRATVGLIVLDFPSVWAQDADDYIHKGLELHDQLRGHSLIKTAFAPHAPYTVSDAAMQRIVTLTEELDIPIHIHAHETETEINESLANIGQRPLSRLEQLGLLSPRMLAVHMTQLNDDEILSCAEMGVHVIHCPESNLKLASGFTPVQKLIDAGVNVALGTDGAASNDDLDMLGEMRTAALLAKGVAHDARAVPAAVALKMATINAAKALGIDNETGSLLVDKSADIIAIKLSDIETQPVYNPLSQIVYSAGREHVTDVWVAGKHLLKDRLLTTIDETELKSRVHKWYARICN